MPETLEILQKIAEIQKEQAVQSQTLQQISRDLQNSTQLAVQQGGQIASLITDVTVIKNEVATWRAEINSINSWRAEAPNFFVPRKEHEASRHEARISTLEQIVLDTANAKAQETRQDAQDKTSFIQWLANNALTILFFLIMLTLTLLNYLKH